MGSMYSMGQTIRFFRRLADIRQDDLALKLGRSQPWLSLVENDSAIPSPDDLNKIITALKIPDGVFE